MIVLPEFEKSFDYENNFYLSCDSQRIRKLLAHYELYRKTLNLPGSLVECGVFKGVSLSRFAMLRKLFGNQDSQKIIAFDTFGTFPETNFKDDLAPREQFITDAGEDSISVTQMMDVLAHKKCSQNVELVEGDICETAEEYVKSNPDLEISILNLDTDVYEPAVAILEHLVPKMVRGGVLILDDYDVFPGETKAVDDYFRDKDANIQHLSFCKTPCYIVIS
jgi:hypothetical protein